MTDYRFAKLQSSGDLTYGGTRLPIRDGYGGVQWIPTAQLSPLLTLRSNLPQLDESPDAQRLALGRILANLLLGQGPDAIIRSAGNLRAQDPISGDANAGSSAVQPNDTQLAQAWLDPLIDSFGAKSDIYKEPIPRLSGQAGAKDIPSWARGMRPRIGEAGKDAAERVLDQKYGKGNWNKDDDGREFYKLQKYFDRSFRDPKVDLNFLYPNDST